MQGENICQVKGFQCTKNEFLIVMRALDNL